jgi:hypothetical protein
MMYEESQGNREGFVAANNESTYNANLEDDYFEFILVRDNKNKRQMTDLELVHDGWALAKLYTMLKGDVSSTKDFKNKSLLLIPSFNETRKKQFVKFNSLTPEEQIKDQPAVDKINELLLSQTKHKSKSHSKRRTASIRRTRRTRQTRTH